MIIRLKDIILAAVGVVVILTVIFVVFSLLKNNAKPVMGQISAERPVVIIDAGHGGVDGGAVSVTGVYESNINLEIAKKTEQLFGFYGINTVMTRTEDVSIHSPGADTIRAKKISDLKNRVTLINSYPDGFLISIHQNTFTDAKYRGAQVFYRPDEASKALAEITQAYLKSALSQEDLNRKITKVPSGVYLMKNVKITAILIEGGFLTNPQEEKLLRDGAYQRKISQAIVAAFIKQFNMKE